MLVLTAAGSVTNQEGKSGHACRGMPARAAMPLPSPVHVCADVAEKYARP